MSQLQTDPITRDLVRTNDTFVRTTGLAEIRQHVAIRLGLFRGECFLAVNLGMRYIGLIFEKGTAPQIIENEIAQTILATPGVVQLTAIEVGAPTALRHASVTFAAMVSVDDLGRRVALHDTVALTFPGSTT